MPRGHRRSMSFDPPGPGLGPGRRRPSWSGSYEPRDPPRGPVPPGRCPAGRGMLDLDGHLPVGARQLLHPRRLRARATWRRPRRSSVCSPPMAPKQAGHLKARRQGTRRRGGSPSPGRRVPRCWSPIPGAKPEPRGGRGDLSGGVSYGGAPGPDEQCSSSTRGTTATTGPRSPERPAGPRGPWASSPLRALDQVSRGRLGFGRPAMNPSRAWPSDSPRRSRPGGPSLDRPLLALLLRHQRAILEGGPPQPRWRTTSRASPRPRARHRGRARP